MEFRLANKSDLDEMVSLALKLWPNHTKDDLNKELTETLESKQQAAFVCLEEDKYVGFSTVSVKKEYVPGAKSYPVGYFEGVYVADDFRRHGVAKKLSALGEQWLKEQGIKQIGSDTWDWNKDSISFHDRLGFKKVDTLVHFIKDISGNSL